MKNDLVNVLEKKNHEKFYKENNNYYYNKSTEKVDKINDGLSKKQVSKNIIYNMRLSIFSVD